MSAAGEPSVLDAIVASARKRVDVAQQRVSRADLERALSDVRHAAIRDVESRATALETEPHAAPVEHSTSRMAHAAWPRPGSFLATLAQPGVRVIAECKRRSPSKGVLRPHYEPVAIAAQYAQAGAAAISVLTEPGFFDGSLDHLEAVHARLPAVPLLRKDFTVDEYQIAEAALAGASAVLLIVGALDQPTLARLLCYAAQAGIDVLTEVHDEDEGYRAIDAGATIVGVNNRNLKTLAVSLATSHRVAPMIASARVRVAESGLQTGADLAALHAVGYGAFLIGERFMTDERPGEGLAQVIADARAALGARA